MKTKNIIALVVVFALLIGGISLFAGAVGTNDAGFYQVKQAFPNHEGRYAVMAANFDSLHAE